MANSIKKNKGGQPTKYDKKYCEEILEYFGVSPYEERMVKKISKDGDVTEVSTDVAADFPSFAGFAAKIGVDRDTLLEWRTKHKEFSGAYKKAKELQENFVVVNGNKGLINTAFGIFTAKNVLGWRDKVETENTNKEIKVNISSDESDL